MVKGIVGHINMVISYYLLLSYILSLSLIPLVSAYVQIHCLWILEWMLRSLFEVPSESSCAISHLWPILGHDSSSLYHSTNTLLSNLSTSWWILDDWNIKNYELHLILSSLGCQHREYIDNLGNKVPISPLGKTSIFFSATNFFNSTKARFIPCFAFTSNTRDDSKPIWTSTSPLWS